MVDSRISSRNYSQEKLRRSIGYGNMKIEGKNAFQAGRGIMSKIKGGVGSRMDNILEGQ